MALLGSFTANTGNWEQGLALATRSRTLNRQHPDVYWLTAIFDHYRRRDYAGGVEILNRVNMPGYPTTLLIRAALYGQLGRVEEGRALLRQAEAILPGCASAEHSQRRWFEPDMVAHVQEGLAKLA